MAGEQPKKAPSGYFLFLSDKRASIETELGTKKGSEVAKKCAEMWKEASEDVRKPYEEKAAKLKAEYETAMQAFKAEGGVVIRKLKKFKKGKDGKKAKKDKDAPKRPAGGGYGIYINEHREAIKKTLPADHKITDISKVAGIKWKAMTAEEKKPYEDKYNAKKEVFEQEMKEYKEKCAAQAPQDEAVSPPAKLAKKRRGDDSEKKQPRAKKTRSSKGFANKMEVEIEETVLLAAKKEGLESSLKNLAARPEVAALGLSADKMLSSLKEHNGLVNATKNALLGA